MSFLTKARFQLAQLLAPKEVRVVPRRHASFVGPAAGKQADWMMGQYGTSAAPYGGDPNALEFESYAREGFANNALIYSAIMYKARASYYAPLQVYAGTPRNPEPIDEDHYLVKLTERPNAYQSFPEFQALNIVYQNIAGEAFILIGRDADGTPNALYPLRPDRMYVLARDEVQYGEDGELQPRKVLGYAYLDTTVSAAKKDPLPIAPEDIINVIYPNPLDFYQGMGRGLSPIRSMAKSGDVDNKITDFLKLFFDNGAMFSGIVYAPDYQLEEEAVARIRDRFMQIYGGYEEWSTVAVLDKDLKYERIGLSFDEMGFEAIDRRNGARVLMPFGVPGVLIGEPFSMDKATLSNVQEMRRIFWEDTFKPELLAYQDQFQIALNTGDAFVAFDFSGVPALSRDVPSLIDAAYRAWQMGTPADIAYAMVGLDAPQFPGSDTSYVPFSVSPVGSLENEGERTDTVELEETTTPEQAAIEALIDVGATPESAQQTVTRLLRADEEEPKTKQHKGWTPEQKQRLWKQIDHTARAFEEPFGNEAVRQFEIDERELLARTNEFFKSLRRRKQSIAYQELLLDWRQYFAMAGDRWREAYVPLIAAVVQAQGEQWADTFGMQFDVRNILAEQWFQEYLLIFAQPIMDTTEKDLSAMLEQAQREGWSGRQIENRLSEIFQQYMMGNLGPADFEWFEQRMPAYRREMIARTETLRSSNAGSWELFKQWGVPMKEWLATPDNRTRESHAAAWGKYSEGGNPGPIPINEPFVVNGYKLFMPGDSSLGAPPSEFINCRCTILPYGDFVGA